MNCYCIVLWYYDKIFLNSKLLLKKIWKTTVQHFTLNGERSTILEGYFKSCTYVLYIIKSKADQLDQVIKHCLAIE